MGRKEDMAARSEPCGDPGPLLRPAGEATSSDPEDLHPVTADLVRRFFAAVAEKLAAAERKYGYSDGWARDDWQDECRRQLHHHAAKGDPRDVAAYAAFCWHHGWSTALAAEDGSPATRIQPGADAGPNSPRSPEGPSPDPVRTQAVSWPWWWSTNEERYYGPCASRADAIVDAWSNDARGAVHIIQAEHGELDCALWDAGQIQDQFDEVNYEYSDGDGDPLSSGIPAKAWEDLAKQIESSIRTLVRKHGVEPWAFRHQTAGEWVDLTQPALAALPSEAQSLLAEIAAGFNPEFGFAESYIEKQVGRLKVVLKGSSSSPTPPEAGAA